MSSLSNERRELLSPVLATADIWCQRLVKLVGNILMKPINEGFTHIISREQSLNSSDDVDNILSEEESDDDEEL